MDKKEPIFNIWGEITVSELVLEAAKVEKNTKNNKKNIASRGWRRTLQWNHSPAADGSTWVLNILWLHFYGL